MKTPETHITQRPFKAALLAPQLGYNHREQPRAAQKKPSTLPILLKLPTFQRIYSREKSERSQLKTDLSQVRFYF